MTRSRFPHRIRSLPAFEGPFEASRLAAEGCEVLFASYPAGTTIDAHTHPTENCGVITRGELILVTNGEETRYRAGEWYRLEPGQEHAARFEVETSEIEFWFAAGHGDAGPASATGGAARRSTDRDPMVTHAGGCHCGRVRFEVDAPADLAVDACNCSICRRSGYLHLIVPKARFRLLSGEASLTSYRFNTGVARHLFCSTCGVESFYVPRSHPDGYSVNARCLDPGSVRTCTVRPFDGANWEQHVDELAPLAE